MAVSTMQPKTRSSGSRETLERSPSQDLDLWTGVTQMDWIHTTCYVYVDKDHFGEGLLTEGTDCQGQRANFLLDLADSSCYLKRVCNTRLGFSVG